MTRIGAVVDVGSNTVRLLVGRIGQFGLDPLHTEGERLGLGEEIESHGRLCDLKIIEAAKTVRRLCECARSAGASEIGILVTAPGRQAENADDLVAALERESGLRVSVLSSQDEGRLSFAGAVADALPPPGLVGVADVGGASSEIVLGHSGSDPCWQRSIDLGALRLSGRVLSEEQPGKKQLEAARADVADAFRAVEPPRPRRALAVGGAARALRRVAGDCLDADEIAEAIGILAKLTHDDIVDRFGVGRQRAPLVLGGAVILAEIQRLLGVRLEVVDGGLREGALLESLDLRRGLARLLRALRGVRHQRFLRRHRALPGRRLAPVPHPVGVELPREPSVGEQRVEAGADLDAQPRVLHRREHLDAPVEVSRHEVGAADPRRDAISGLKGEDPAVLEEAAEHAAAP